MSLRDDVLEFLRQNHGRAVTAQQVMNAVGNRPSALRRLRELRRGDAVRGLPRWDIRTYRDDNQLKPNEYRLASVEPLAPLPTGAPRVRLLDRIRQASEDDQLAAYAWLRTRYGHLSDTDLNALMQPEPV